MSRAANDVFVHAACMYACILLVYAISSLQCYVENVILVRL